MVTEKPSISSFYFHFQILCLFHTSDQSALWETLGRRFSDQCICFSTFYCFFVILSSVKDYFGEQCIDWSMRDTFGLFYSFFFGGVKKNTFGLSGSAPRVLQRSSKRPFGRTVDQHLPLHWVASSGLFSRPFFLYIFQKSVFRSRYVCTGCPKKM